MIGVSSPPRKRNGRWEPIVCEPSSPKPKSSDPGPPEENHPQGIPPMQSEGSEDERYGDQEMSIEELLKTKQATLKQNASKTPLAAKRKIPQHNKPQAATPSKKKGWNLFLLPPTHLSLGLDSHQEIKELLRL